MFVPPAEAARATGHITQIVELIQRLIDTGHAYPGAGDVYFNVLTFQDYGKLSGHRIEDVHQGEGVGAGKRDHAATEAVVARALELHGRLDGVVFVALKTGGSVRTAAVRLAAVLSVPSAVLVAAFGLWTQLGHGKAWTWIVLVAGLLAQLAAVAAAAAAREGWAFLSTTVVVAAVVIVLFGSLYPNLVPSTIDPAYSITIYNGSSSPYTLKVMTWAAVIFTPLVLVYQAWTYWVFRKRVFAESIPHPIGLPLRRVP